MGAWAEYILDEAEKRVTSKSKTIAHKIGTMAWYTGRKQLRNAPRAVISGVLGLIPFNIGNAAQLGFNKGWDKIKGSRRQKKLQAAQASASVVAPQDPDALAVYQTLAKIEIKDLKDVLAPKLSDNMVKLKDARTALTTAQSKLVNALSLKSVDFDQVWEFALAIYVVRRYEKKVMGFVESLRVYADGIEKYVNASNAETLKLEDDFATLLDELEDIVAEGLKTAASGTGYAPMV